MEAGELFAAHEPSLSKTRIGVFDFSEPTHTEPLPFLTDGAHRSSSTFSCGLASDLVGFLQEDPLRADAGWGLYPYAGNAPVIEVDPLGLIHYNKPPPDTVPVTGRTAAALECLERCLQCVAGRPKLDLLVTGGAEKTGHKGHSHHYIGQAVDISYFNHLDTIDLFRCAEHCGFSAGQDEPKNLHWHLQISPGNGVRQLPYVLAPVPECCLSGDPK